MSNQQANGGSSSAKRRIRAAMGARPASGGRPAATEDRSAGSAEAEQTATDDQVAAEAPSTEASSDEAAADDAKRPATKSPAKKSPAKKSAVTKALAGDGSDRETNHTETRKPVGSAKARKDPDVAKQDRPPTAGDYARTTGGAAASTAVIPAVKDEPRSSGVRPEPEKQPAAAPTGRQASLRLVRIDPWSVTRLAFVISVALMIVAVVAVTIFWVVLDLTGIWDQLNGSITNVLSDNEGSFDLTDYLGLGRLVGLALVLSAINVVVMTALATIAAHLYNLAAQLLGGIQVTFGDD